MRASWQTEEKLRQLWMQTVKVTAVGEGRSKMDEETAKESACSEARKKRNTRFKN